MHRTNPRSEWRSPPVAAPVIFVDDEPLFAFDRGWQAAMDHVSTPLPDDPAILRRVDDRIQHMRQARADHAQRTQRLNEAESAGPNAYAEERARQGLIEYDPRGVTESWAVTP